MTMMERITQAINKGIATKTPSNKIAELVIHALREPDEVDVKILMKLHEFVFKVGPAKAWDVALDQIVDPD